MIELVGYAAGALLMLSFLPQVVQTILTREAGDISLWMLSITLGSAVLYEVYAAMLGLVPVLVMNGVFGLLVALEIALKLRFERRAAAADGE
ncbi:MAG: PQ-loop domain-containing transporter [Planctomycetota bacterium]